MSPGLSVSTVGRLAALASATSFAGVSMLAGFVYSGGVTPASVIAARLLFGLFGTLAVVAYLRRPWMVPIREWRPTLVIACAWLTVNVCYMASFYYIPVSLAVLIFFTFPVQVALIGPLLARRRPEPVTLGAALIAFAGLALALGPDFDGLDWRGCALALTAAIALMTTFLMSRRLVVDQDMFTFSFNLHLLCGVAVVVYVGGTGGIPLPAAPVAIAALFGVGVFYILAVCPMRSPFSRCWGRHSCWVRISAWGRSRARYS
jgi:drug/metabolite transporter (DMT)-like permease